MNDAIRREWLQLSGAEVPGFNVRTQCDDMIAKLWALRDHVYEPVPDGLEALLDDIDELVERAVDLGYDADSPAMGVGGVDSPVALPERVRRYAGGRLAESGSSPASCSCGGVWMPE